VHKNKKNNKFFFFEPEHSKERPKVEAGKDSGIYFQGSGPQFWFFNKNSIPESNPGFSFTTRVAGSGPGHKN
jgi:hypothetical protein